MFSSILCSLFGHDWRVDAVIHGILYKTCIRCHADNYRDR